MKRIPAHQDPMMTNLAISKTNIRKVPRWLPSPIWARRTIMRNGTIPTEHAQLKLSAECKQTWPRCRTSGQNYNVVTPVTFHTDLGMISTTAAVKEQGTTDSVEDHYQ